MAFVQVAAGSVHSLVLTTDGRVFSCGINEKGIVPVQGLEAEGTTDTFSEIVFTTDIQRLGKIVQITAGASSLTEKGSVIAWGNLRDTQGEVKVHETLTDIQKKPMVIAAGENHLAMLSNEGQILTFGEGSMGQLGRSVRTEHIRARYMVDESGTSLTLRVLEHKQFVRFVNIRARGFWTIGRAEDGRLFVCGLNNFGQLAVPPQSSPTHRKSAAGTSDQDDGGIGPPKPKSPATIAAGQEESNKVALLTCATAFPADKAAGFVAMCGWIFCHPLTMLNSASKWHCFPTVSTRWWTRILMAKAKAEPPKAKVSVPIGANFVQQSPWEPMDGNFVDFPLPDLPLPNKLRIRFMIEYIDHSVIASLRANKQVWYTKGTTVYYCVDSDDTESDAHQQQEHQQNWNVLAREIWPIFSANMRNLMFNNEHHLDQLCRRISPSCLTDLDKLDWIYSGRLFPDVILFFKGSYEVYTNL
ncbi:hypothetical protein niasHT_039585 [Heterodera trifolii]|uniref:Uncharacterized protein n=1 Tax=Heterodera trifolii TaxID=157864 RepID=A0ABD2IBN5_9BILA